MAKLLDLIRMSMRGELPPPPVATLIGFRPTSVEPGRAVVEFEAAERHANPLGTLHGGILCDIADAAMGIAYASTLEEGETFTTLELKINFLKPVWNARLRAVADVVNGGRTVGLVACDVFDEKDRLVARATSTCLTLRGEQAAGRDSWAVSGGRGEAGGRAARGAG
ncbi:MAG: PaaI family thioesterase [Candidatus Rokubacteria bacterium]|nr:PaaI family thioesterase [Candidatus Rokubacteria bacterium]